MSEYEQGYRDGAADAANLKRIEHRISAFGAIRRAAELAREYDRAAFDVNGRRPQVYDDCVFAASTIREAIRTALESPKA